MKRIAIIQVCGFAFLVVCGFGAYRIFQWFEIRKVLLDIDPQIAALKSLPMDYPLRDRIEAVDRFAKAVIVVDAAYTPSDFRDTFELWKAACVSLDKKMEAYDFPIGRNFAERQLVTDTGTRLDQVRMKYGFRAGGEPPVRSLIGDIGDGLFNLGFGEYLVLIGLGVCKASKDPMKDKIWRGKWSVWATSAGILLLLEGASKLYSGFS